MTDFTKDELREMSKPSAWLPGDGCREAQLAAFALAQVEAREAAERLMRGVVPHLHRVQDLPNVEAFMAHLGMED